MGRFYSSSQEKCGTNTQMTAAATVCRGSSSRRRRGTHAQSVRQHAEKCGRRCFACCWRRQQSQQQRATGRNRLIPGIEGQALWLYLLILSRAGGLAVAPSPVSITSAKPFAMECVEGPEKYESV
jgi:hypothetical protein